jgi:hypothetical protein
MFRLDVGCLVDYFSFDPRAGGLRKRDTSIARRSKAPRIRRLTDASRGPTTLPMFSARVSNC